MRKLLLIPLLLIGLLVLLPGAAFAQEKEWHFADWQVDIDINEDSSFHVKETHTYDFVGDFSWVTRDLVKQGEMTISNIRVFDGDTGEELFSPDIQITPGYYSDLVTINFNLSNVQKKYIIEYDVFNAIGYFDTWDELYWNAVSDDRDVAIDQVDVWVNLPVAVDPAQLSGRLLIGAYGTSEEANTWDVNDQGTFHFWGKNIEAYENFTIVAGWPKDIVPEPDLLKITSNPDTADININGHDSYYNTPMQFYVGDMIEYGENVIEVSKFGYEKQANKIIVEKGGGVYFADFQLEETLWYQIGIVLIVVLLGLYIASPMLVLVLLLRKWLKIGR
ncbi:DUF2207 domain-containing protein, partial [Patescibacteria group bacterium]|nr:DUF2207 domain-containing protein [Patescibacteria group bacterium]